MVELIKHLFGAPEHILYGNTIGTWLTAGVVALAVWSILGLLHRLIKPRHERYLSAGHRTPVRLLAHLIGNTQQFLLFGIASYSGLQSLTLPAKLQRGVADFRLLSVLLQAGLWAGRAVRFYLELKEKERAPDHVLASSLDIINFVARLRSETGELIILSNADILKSRVRNDAHAAESRAPTTIRVAYDTPADKLREIPQLIERIVREQPKARFERCHLKNFGDWALQFELAYFRREPDSYPLLDLQQAVNLRIVSAA